MAKKKEKEGTKTWCITCDVPLKEGGHCRERVPHTSLMSECPNAANHKREDD